MNQNYLFSIKKYFDFNFNNYVKYLIFYGTPTFIKSRKKLFFLLINNKFKILISHFLDEKLPLYSFKKEDNKKFIIQKNFSQQIIFFAENNYQSSFRFDIKLPIYTNFNNKFEDSIYFNPNNLTIKIKDNNDIFIASFSQKCVEINYNLRKIKKYSLFFDKLKKLSIDICPKKDVFYYDIIQRFFNIIYLETNNDYFIKILKKI